MISGSFPLFFSAIDFVLSEFKGTLPKSKEVVVTERIDPLTLINEPILSKAKAFPFESEMTSFVIIDS